MHREREDNFKSCEVKRLKECALALRLSLSIYAIYLTFVRRPLSSSMFRTCKVRLQCTLDVHWKIYSRIFIFRAKVENKRRASCIFRIR